MDPHWFLPSSNCLPLILPHLFSFIVMINSRAIDYCSQDTSNAISGFIASLSWSCLSLLSAAPQAFLPKSFSLLLKEYWVITQCSTWFNWSSEVSQSSVMTRRNAVSPAQIPSCVSSTSSRLFWSRVARAFFFMGSANGATRIGFTCTLFYL